MNGSIFVRYEWHDGFRSVQMSPDVSLPQFVVIGHRQRQIEVSLSSGNYSRLLADVQFTRSMGYYMIQVTILVKTKDCKERIKPGRTFFQLI